MRSNCRFATAPAEPWGSLSVLGSLGGVESFDGQSPVAHRSPSVRELHGRADADDYAWMRDHEHPLLAEYLAAERAYYDAFATRLADLTGRLAAESAGRIPAGDETSVGWPLAGFTYR